MNQLDQLKQYTTVVVDSGDIDVINQYQAQDATTNPSIILNTLKNPKYTSLLDEAVSDAIKIEKDKDKIIQLASTIVGTKVGIKLMDIVPGYVSTEVDARASFNTEASITYAQKIIELYDNAGADSNRVLIKLAATWQGIKAAEYLEKRNIKTNLTLIFSKAQAIAAADAGAFLISPFVGRITDWYRNNQQLSEETDPGVKSVKTIYNYYKSNGFKTIVMGASFRNITQILSLSGCDRLTISPNLLEKLTQSHHPIVRILNPEIISTQAAHARLNEPDFYWHHHSDEMAVSKLRDGIADFANDQILLEKMISEYLI